MLSILPFHHLEGLKSWSDSLPQGLDLPFPDNECNFSNVPLTLGPILLYYAFICFSIKTLEEIKDHWDHFAGAFETFSLWISDKEKQLDGVKSSTLPLEQQIATVKVCVAVLQYNVEVRRK